MHRVFTTTLATLALCAAVLLPAGVAGAAPADSRSGAAYLSVAGSTQGPATPTNGTTPPGPVDPGTGETGQAKETRVDYAPYVIGAAVLALLIAAFVVWRRRGGAGPSSKAARRADTE